MGSKQAEKVVEVIHAFLDEMNQVIRTAKSMRNDLKRYSELLKENLDLPSELFSNNSLPEISNIDKRRNTEPMSTEHLRHSVRERSTSKLLASALQLPSDSQDERELVAQELHEIHSAVERSTDLQEQFEASVTTPILDNNIEEIAAAMWPQTLLQHSSSYLSTDLESVASAPSSQKSEKRFKRNSTQKDFFFEDSTLLPMATVAKLKLFGMHHSREKVPIQSPKENASRKRSSTSTRISKGEDSKSADTIKRFSDIKLATIRWRRRARSKEKGLETEQSLLNPTFPPALPILSFVRMKRFAERNIANRKTSITFDDPDFTMHRSPSVSHRTFARRSLNIDDLDSSKSSRRRATAPSSARSKSVPNSARSHSVPNSAPHSVSNSARPLDESEALELIGRNAMAYQERRRASIQQGVQCLMSNLPESTKAPTIRAFVRQADQGLEIERIIEAQSKQDQQADERKKKIVISCESNFTWLWDVLIFVFSIYMAVIIPLQLSLSQFQCSSVGTFKVISPLVDTVYVLDILLKMRTTYHNYVKEEIWNVSKIQRRYLHSLTFKVDLCAAVPWASLVTCVALFHSPLGILAFFRVLKIVGEKYWQKIKMSLSKSIHQNPAIMRMVGIVLLFCLVAHIFACVYAYNHQYLFTGRWALENDLESHTSSMSATYFEALYFSLAVIAGNDRAPSSVEEYYFGILGLLISFIVNAVIIGSATNVLSQMDTTAVAQKEQLDSVSEYLRYRRVPLKLYNKIISYYSYLWEIGQSSHSETLFQELPGKLKLELTVTLNKKLIQSVPLFKACSPAGVIMLVKRLKPSIILPMELIIKEGERADSMFFLNRGTVRCYLEVGKGQKVYLTTLRDGSFFGEVAILEDNLRRTANVKAFSFCELQTLMSHDFQAVLRAFPDFQQAVAKVAQARQEMSRQLKMSHSEKTLYQFPGISDLKNRLQKIVNANMFIKHSLVHPIEEEEEEKTDRFGDEDSDLYQAILNNQRQMTRMAAEDAMQNKHSIDEQDFMRFEQAVNSKYEKQVKRYQTRKEKAMTLSAAAFVDLQKQIEQKRRSSPTPTGTESRKSVLKKSGKIRNISKSLSKRSRTESEISECSKVSLKSIASRNQEEDHSKNPSHRSKIWDYSPSLETEMDEMLNDIKK